MRDLLQQALTDNEGYLWLGPEGVGEGSGDGIRGKKKEKKKESWAE